MEGSYRDKYSFVGEWYDSQASLTRLFHIYFYPQDGTLEMYELKTRRTFVRRVKVEGITLDKFYIGCTLYILGRLIKITDFACEHTRNKLHKDMEIYFVCIKPIPTNITGKILRHLHMNGIRVTRIKKTRLFADDVIYIYRSLASDPTYPFQNEYMTNQLVYGVEVVGKNVFELLTRHVGNKDPLQAEAGTIRALYGTDEIRNCVYLSPNKESALEDLNYFFTSPTRLPLTATLSNCTLCIVKPHAVREGKLGLALECIDEGGFNVTALNMLIVENVNAAEFFEVYKGIVSEYKGMVEELASGPCVAMEIVAKDSSQNTAVEFRKLVGPSDPEIARLLRPHTMRAKLGNTKIQNAIHCSDLPEDGLLEVEYFFKIL